MSEAILVALITGGLSLAGVVVTCLATAKKTEKAAAVAQAVTETKIDELTRDMFAAAEALEFERAADLRDRIATLKKSASINSESE